MRWLFATVAVLILTGCGGSTFELFPDPENSSTPEAIPAITSFAPTNGRAGMVVTIKGTNFSSTPANNIVKFNGVTAVVSSATATQIITSVPVGATTGPISVTVGSKVATSAAGFSVTVLMGGALQGHPLTLANSVTTLAGSAGTTGAVDGTGAAAGFYSPKGITTDGTNLYVADSNNNTIRKIVIASGAVSTLAGSAGALGPDDGTGTAARFDFPSGITTDGTNLFVADSNNSTIRKIVIATGAVTTLAGSAGVIGFDDGAGTDALFNFPSGITTDGTNLYVADSNNNTIRKIVIATGAVSTLAGTAEEAGFADGTGTAAYFDLPTGITTDGANLYVDDSNNNTIRKIVIATGSVSTLAGTAGGFGSTDATGSAAQFDFPNRITTDGTNLYVSDANNNTIRKIVIATGAVSTIAGSAGVIGFDDGTGTDALFDFPSGITTDGTNLYVVDENNHTIRKIE